MPRDGIAEQLTAGCCQCPRLNSTDRIGCCSRRCHGNHPVPTRDVAEWSRASATVGPSKAQIWQSKPRKHTNATGAATSTIPTELLPRLLMPLPSQLPTQRSSGLPCNSRNQTHAPNPTNLGPNITQTRQHSPVRSIRPYTRWPVGQLEAAGLMNLRLWTIFLGGGLGSSLSPPSSFCGATFACWRFACRPAASEDDCCWRPGCWQHLAIAVTVHKPV